MPMSPAHPHCTDACVKVAQSCPCLCGPVDCSLPGSSAHGILQAGKLEYTEHCLELSAQGLVPLHWDCARDERSYKKIQRDIHWEGLFANLIFTKGLVPRIWNKHSKFNFKTKQSNQKMGKRFEEPLL